MTVTGTWNLTIATPIGKQLATLEITEQGTDLRAVARARSADIELVGLTLTGDRLTWAQSITRPMPTQPRLRRHRPRRRHVRHVQSRPTPHFQGCRPPRRRDPTVTVTPGRRHEYLTGAQTPRQDLPSPVTDSGQTTP